MLIFEYLLVGIFGICIGSFSSMLIYRLPKIQADNSINLLMPKSHCPRCKEELGAFMLIPILSFLIQKGKCKYCNKKIHISYLLNELIHLIVILTILFYIGFSIYGFIIYLIFSILYVLFFLDLKYLYLPFYLNVSLIFIGLTINYFFKTFVSIEEAILGSVVGFGVLWLVNVIYKYFRSKDGIGGGDFILLAGLGGIFGLLALGPIMLLGSSCSLLIYAMQKNKNNKEIPLGLGLILGSVLYFLIRYQII